MERILSICNVASAINGEVINCREDILISSVSTDTRTITDGALFVALKGENFDGHKFISVAVENGAVCCVVNKGTDNPKNLPIIEVEDTAVALRDLAEYYRKKFDVSVVGITGSVGKTSTKDMIASVLEQSAKTHRTKGNFNNEIGVPLTVYDLMKDDEFMVIEMGMSNFGEISKLTQIAKPGTAVITNIGISHIEHLGSREGIRKAKLEILEGLQIDGTVILNGDDDMLWGIGEEIEFETLYYGIRNKNCDMIAYDIRNYSDSSEFTCKIEGEECKFLINVPGEHHIYNALAAILIGLKYNVSIEDISAGIRNFSPTGLRQTVIELPNYTVIRDCYNASPDSMKSGLNVLALHENCKRRVACLADMLELGDVSEEAHLAVGKIAVDTGVDVLITVGKEASHIAEGARKNGMNSKNIYEFENNTELKNSLKEILCKDDVILVKGSRGMHLEEIADAIGELD